MNNKKLLKVLIACIAAVFFLAGTAIACQAARLGSFLGGAEVEGVIYDYEVQGSTSPKGGYHCFLYCRYVDEGGHNFITEFQYNFSSASYEDAENFGKNQLNKPVKLYLKGWDCISETEIKRYVPFVGISVALFFACAVTVAVPLIIEAVKKRRIKARAYGEEDYLI